MSSILIDDIGAIEVGYYYDDDDNDNDDDDDDHHHHHIISTIFQVFIYSRSHTLLNNMP